MKRKPLSIFDAAKPFRDAFHYDPGHSDLDNEQPINITVTLGDWRKLDFALRTMPSETAPRVVATFSKEAIDAAYAAERPAELERRDDKPKSAALKDAYYEGYGDALKDGGVQSAVAPTKQTAMLGVIEDALEDFPEGNDLYGVYAEWKMKLDGALDVIREHFRGAPVVPSATGERDAARLLWLETLLKHCPHAELKYNDDPEPGEYKGWTLTVESCSTLSLEAPTLEAIIDLGMTAEADEDGNVTASAAPDRTTP